MQKIYKTEQIKSPVKKLIWVNIIFFAVTTLVGIIGGPLYIARYGISASEIILFLFWSAATGFGITVGYHRHFAHATFKTNPVVRFFLLFFGAASFEQSALEWASQHRDHHQYVDTDRDPYSIAKGFFYAHVGWLIFWKHTINFENAKDLQKDPLVMHQFHHYHLWGAVAGIIVPVFMGAMTGHALGAFIFSVCLRLTFVYHSTFCINSVCHMFGKATYDIYSTAKDHWFVALLTSGEGYHNFHHRFPGDYRNGVRWYHYDPSKWLINFLSRIGLASDLKRVSNFRIMEARLAGETQRASDSLARAGEAMTVQSALQLLKVQQEKVKAALSNWETAVHDYREMFRAKVANQSEELMKAAFKKTRHARAQFKQVQQQWRYLMNLHPVNLEKTLLGNFSL